MKFRDVCWAVSLACALSVVHAQRIDGLDYGEPNNGLLQVLSNKEPSKDLVALGKFGDGNFWVSDKSVRRNWQSRVIFKMFKVHDKPKYLPTPNDAFKRQKRVAYTYVETIAELDCEKKMFSIKAESMYASPDALVSSAPYDEEFLPFRSGTVMERLHQTYCF